MKNTFRVWHTEGLSGLEAGLGQGEPRPQPAHFHEGYELCAFVAPPGTEQVRYRGSVHPVAAADLVVMAPGEVHSTQVGNGGAVTCRTLLFSPRLVGSLVEDVAEGAGAALPDLSGPVLADEELVRDFVSLHQALEPGGEPLEREERVLRLWGRLLERHARVAPRLPRLRRERAVLQQVQGYMREHLTRRVGLEELAAVARMSRFHFCRVFQQEVGMSPYAYHAHLRMLRARELLAQGQAIAEVALEVGLADQSHLNRLFLRAMGMTPGRYVAAVRGRKQAARLEAHPPATCHGA